jgi:hypothetical protein
MRLWHIVVGIIIIEVAIGAFVSPTILIFPFLTGVFFLAARYLAPDRDFGLLFQRMARQSLFVPPIVILAVVLTWNSGIGLADFVARFFFGALAGSFALLGLALHYRIFLHRRYSKR